MTAAAYRPSWRPGVLLIGFFLVGAMVVEGSELLRFTQTFRDVRTHWLPVSAVVTATTVGTRSAHSSSSRGLSGHELRYSLIATVRYTIDGALHEAQASGWEEGSRQYVDWEQPDVLPGATVPIRVRPDATDQPTLLGEWTKPSTVPLIRMLSVELLLLLGLVVCGRFAVRRD